MAVVFKERRTYSGHIALLSGCTHGIVHRLVGEVLEELDVLDRAIAVAPVGCSVFAYDYFNCDAHEAPTEEHLLWLQGLRESTLIMLFSPTRG